MAEWLVVHKINICVIQAETKASSYQLAVEFVDDIIHRVAEELVHFAEAALGVEGGVVEVVSRSKRKEVMT